jgi:hypothetical protein
MFLIQHADAHDLLTLPEMVLRVCINTLCVRLSVLKAWIVLSCVSTEFTNGTY